MGYNPWYRQNSKYFYLSRWTLMRSFERSLSKLSENHKIVEIEPTEFKLWQLKESPNHWLNGGGGSWTSFNSHNFSIIDQWSNFRIFWKLKRRPFKLCVSIQNFVGALICHFSALECAKFSTLKHGLCFLTAIFDCPWVYDCPISNTKMCINFSSSCVTRFTRWL